MTELVNGHADTGANATVARPARRSLGRVAFDLALVVVGALLALGLSDWQQDRERGQMTRQVLQALEQELKQNRAAIERELPMQDQISEAFRLAAERFETKKEFAYPEAAVGRNAAIHFSHAAYDSALLNQTLPRLEIDALLKLSALYSEQAVYAELWRLYATATVQVDFADGTRYFRLLSNEYAQLAQSERALLPFLDAAQAAVEHELAR